MITNTVINSLQENIRDFLTKSDYYISSSKANDEGFDLNIEIEPINSRSEIVDHERIHGLFENTNPEFRFEDHLKYDEGNDMGVYIFENTELNSKKNETYTLESGVKIITSPYLTKQMTPFEQVTGTFSQHFKDNLQIGPHCESDCELEEWINEFNNYVSNNARKLYGRPEGVLGSHFENEDNLQIKSMFEDEDESELDDISMLRNTLDAYFMRKGELQDIDERGTFIKSKNVFFLYDVQNISKVNDSKYRVHFEALPINRSHKDY